MKKEKHRKSRLSLTLLFAVVILIFLIATLLLSGVAAYILIRLDVISVTVETAFSPTQFLLLLSLNSLILGSILSAIASRYPMRPVNKLVAQMNRLASGDFQARLEYSGPLEKYPAIRELCGSFNTMAEELGATEMLRSDFINNFSHEFKTPIVSIAGFAKLLKRGDLTPQQQAEYLDIIEEESLRLTALATNMLNLTKYENQTILTEVTRFNLSEQIRSCILALEGKWARQDISFDLNFVEHAICANRDMLKHVWLNLLDNAIKFSPAGSTVAVGLQDLGGQLEIRISNPAADIPPEQQAKLFRKFYQADESHAAEGNGIGLALVKRVVELHGGCVTVQSRDGLVTFTVILPAEQ